MHGICDGIFKTSRFVAFKHRIGNGWKISTGFNDVSDRSHRNGIPDILEIGSGTAEGWGGGEILGLLNWPLITRFSLHSFFSILDSHDKYFCSSQRKRNRWWKYKNVCGKWINGRRAEDRNVDNGFFSRVSNGIFTSGLHNQIRRISYWLFRNASE